jgi:nitrite reductase/ring-hydroxylating ferredoxin subunit
MPRNERGDFVFIRIGQVAEVGEGSMRVFDVDGSKVNVSRTAGGLYGIDDTCTHLRCSLANGRLEGTTVTCACHGSQFDITSGAVLRGPAQSPVRSWAVEVRGDELFAEVR